MEEFISKYGLIAVFIGTILEGDLTLVVAGVLARYALVRFSFGEVLLIGTAGAVIGDIVSYSIGRAFREQVQSFGLYRHAQPKLQRLKGRFGTFSVFAVKYFRRIEIWMLMVLGTTALIVKLRAMVLLAESQTK